jgi:hypothetical protein
MRSPNSNADNLLSGVDARSGRDVWAVGSFRVGKLHRTLVEHWDSTKWTIVPSPNLGHTRHSYLDGVTAISTSDVWAVGYAAAANRRYLKTLIEHWDGASWAVVPSPNPTCYCALKGISAASATDAWAVGYYHLGSDQALFEHWDGVGWTQY